MTPASSIEKSQWILAEGSSFPLGATWVESDDAYNFAIYSKHAHSVELCFFGTENLAEIIYTFSFDPL